MTEPRDKKFVLALSGGGIRGLATVSFLSKLEQELGIHLFEDFDAFFGTSSGAMFAAHVASCGCSATESMKICTKESFRRIMPKSFWDYILPFQFRPKYNGVGKRHIIDKFIPDIKMNETKKPFYAVTYGLSTRLPHIYGGQSDMTSIRDVVDASSAAPTYFPPVCVKTKDSLLIDDIDDRGEWQIDGGVAANNPSTVAISEACNLWGDECISNDVKVLSVGTGLDTRNVNGSSARNWGVVRWATQGCLVNIMLGAPDKLSAMESKMFLGDNYLHIDSELDTVSDDLDNTSDDNYDALVKLGERWYYDNEMDLRNFFGAH